MRDTQDSSYDSYHSLHARRRELSDRVWKEWYEKNLVSLRSLISFISLSLLTSSLIPLHRFLIHFFTIIYTIIHLRLLEITIPYQHNISLIICVSIGKKERQMMRSSLEGEIHMEEEIRREGCDMASVNS